jgi:crotonobetainyl-CoA:carnitine CoA-transferase CaiB-like acyl-CoA transferase
VGALGNPEWAHEPRFGTLLARKDHEAELDSLVAEWTSARERDEIVCLLRARKLRAAPVSSMADLFADPQLVGRTWKPVEHPVLGKVHVMAPPFLLRDTPPSVGRAAPLLGEHTREVLSGVLGLDEAEIDDLERQGVLE